MSVLHTDIGGVGLYGGSGGRTVELFANGRRVGSAPADRDGIEKLLDDTRNVIDGLKGVEAALQDLLARMETP